MYVPAVALAAAVGVVVFATTSASGSSPSIRDPFGNVVEEHPAGSYEYHPTHHHWHIADVALFQVHSGSETGRSSARAPRRSGSA